MIGVLKGLLLTWKTHWRRPVTKQYPNEKLPLAPRYWGFPGLIWDHEVGEPFCTGCMVCIRNCPTQCMHATMEDNLKFKEGTSKRRKIVGEFTINLSRCISCNICVEVCNFDAIEMSHTVEVANYNADMVMDLPQLIQLHENKLRAVAEKPETDMVGSR